MSVLKFIWYIPRNIVCLLIRGYQKTLSPDHGPLKGMFPNGYCRFTPTCSDYSYGVVKKHGVLWGVVKAVWRILRCNPCGKGGHDPVR